MQHNLKLPLLWLRRMKRSYHYYGWEEWNKRNMFLLSVYTLSLWKWQFYYVIIILAIEIWGSHRSNKIVAFLQTLFCSSKDGTSVSDEPVIPSLHEYTAHSYRYIWYTDIFRISHQYFDMMAKSWDRVFQCKTLLEYNHMEQWEDQEGNSNHSYGS